MFAFGTTHGVNSLEINNRLPNTMAMLKLVLKNREASSKISGIATKQKYFNFSNSLNHALRQKHLNTN